MDGLTHTLLGLTSAKAGLERLSPYTAAVCILAANASDIDVVTVLGGRWTALHYHRGITHSIVGTLTLGLMIPSLFYLIDRLAARIRKHPARIRYRGLLVASLIASATHPLMDWTNNYGVRPLLPWNGKWFYGDLVFIIDPYIWLILGGTAFLLTSNRRGKIVVWSIIACVTTLLIFLASARGVPGSGNLRPVRIIWIIGLLLFLLARSIRINKGIGKSIAMAALATVILYWGALSLAHRSALRASLELANQVASQRGEHFIRAAAMPTAANPFRWLCVAETDRAMYRFFATVGLENSVPEPNSITTRTDSPRGIERFEKPSGRDEQLVASAARDPRAQILLGFARFPIERVEDDNCLEQTLVQFADLRYTEPGGALRGNFALDVP
ncbi:MAG TPA: metal-dependent hydrolase, partial [Candidatus Udaeobacter sp.]